MTLLLLWQEKVLSEARILKNLSHRNIIQFHHMLEDDSHLYLVMEVMTR